MLVPVREKPLSSDKREGVREKEMPLQSLRSLTGKGGRRAGAVLARVAEVQSKVVAGFTAPFRRGVQQIRSAEILNWWSGDERQMASDAKQWSKWWHDGEH